MSNSEYNDIILLGRVLKSKICIQVLNYLTEGDASNQEIYEKLKNKIGTGHRASIFAALNKIKEAGLVEKYYDDESNKIMYILTVKSVKLDFKSLDLEKLDEFTNH